MVGISTIARDITERRQTEQSLRSSEVEYRLLFQANPVPMLVFDRDTLHVLAVNEAALRQYGYTRQEFLSMTIADLYPKEDIPELAEDLARRARGVWGSMPGVIAQRIAKPLMSRLPVTTSTFMESMADAVGCARCYRPQAL